MPSDPPDLPPGFEPFAVSKPVARRPAKKAVKKAAPAKAGSRKAPVKRPARKAPAKKAARKLRSVPPLPPEELPGAEAALDAQLAVVVAQAEALDPAYEAYMLKQEGRSWREVAQRTGYRDVAAAHNAVTEYFRSFALTQQQELRVLAFELEMERLDMLTAAYHNQAMEGDLDAAKFLLAVSTQRGRWQGWDRETKVSEQRTIIISGGPGMADDMRRAALEMHPHLVIDGRPVDG